MTRPFLAVRDAGPDDLPAMLDMWREMRDDSNGFDRAAPQPSEQGVRDRLCAAQQDGSVRILIALWGGETVGMAVLTHQPFAALFDTYSVHLDYLHVRPGFRRRGVGHALLAAATSFADEVGAEHIMASVSPQLRDTQRFFARLGFAPIVVRRVAPVSMLRRRLVADRHVVTKSDLLARRRSLRSRSRLREAILPVAD